MIPKSELEAKTESTYKLIRDKNIQFCDMKLTDLFGQWQHVTIPISYVMDEDFWQNGHGFDGSSIRGFKAIEESDMLLIPDPETAVLDPVCQIPTLSVICDVLDPLSRQPYSRDPRFIAKKAENFLKNSGFADTSFWGPEMEFFLFNHVAFGQTANEGFYKVDSEEGVWTSGLNGEPNLGYKIRHKEGYFPVAPHDTLQDIRSEMVQKMLEVGINVETHHHEVATAGQGEIDMKYNTLVSMADFSLMYKYIVKNVARAHDLVATFMPKPLFGDNGSGMHTHQSLWKDGQNLFFDEQGYGQLSQLAKYYIGGILKHAESLMAFCAPTTNSYKRLVPGFEAPVNLTYSQRNRSAAVRIPMYSKSPKSKRIEFRSPDATANPYLAFSAMLMAGLDGMVNRIDPGEPFDENTYESQKAKSLKTVPRSLDDSLNALENDHIYLLKGDVFTKDVLDTWIAYKREKEINGLRLRPHPHEFHMYFDA